jgi:hypothetical protein
MNQDPQRDDITAERLVDYGKLILEQAEWLKSVVTENHVTMARSEPLKQLEEYLIAMGKEIIAYNKAHQPNEAERAGRSNGGAKRRTTKRERQRYR